MPHIMPSRRIYKGKKNKTRRGEVKQLLKLARKVGKNVWDFLDFLKLHPNRFSAAADDPNDEEGVRVVRFKDRIVAKFELLKKTPDLKKGDQYLNY